MVITTEPHTVKSYDEELRYLEATIAVMGHLVRGQVEDAVEILAGGDVTAASRVLLAEDEVDSCQHIVNDLTVRVLALRNPVACDLRVVVGSLKLASELERIGDIATSITKRMINLRKIGTIPAMDAIVHMGQGVLTMLTEVTEACEHQDASGLDDVWRRDEDVDSQCAALLRAILATMIDNPSLVEIGSHLLLMSKNIERIGDHVTNIAEILYYIVTGENIGVDRPKGDTSSFMCPSR